MVHKTYIIMEPIMNNTLGLDLQHNTSIANNLAAGGVTCTHTQKTHIKPNNGGN